MKFSGLLVATSLLAFTSATRLCDQLNCIRANITTLSGSLSNITDRGDRPSLMAAFYSLNAAISALNSLNYQINTTTGAINYGSFSLANLDVQTGCSIGWLINLGGGLDQVDTDLQQIYQTGAQDLVNGDVKKVQGYGPHVHSLANQALQALNSSNQALGTLDQYNDDVLCW